MNIKELINQGNSDKEISKYDYKTISTQIDQLYNTLLYREVYKIEDRKEKYEELLKYINYFRRLPNARKITRLQYLSRLFDLYLGNLALCEGEINTALKHYFEAMSIKEVNRKIKDIRSKKCSRVELCDIMPVVYNIDLMIRMCGLEKKADSYLSNINQATHMWNDKMQEIKPNGFTFPSLKDSLLFTKSGYEFCCEEYYDKLIGRTNYRFNTGLDDNEIIVPEIITKDGKEYIKLGYCSDLIDRQKLLNGEAAKIIANYREF